MDRELTSARTAPGWVWAVLAVGFLALVALASVWAAGNGASSSPPRAADTRPSADRSTPRDDDGTAGPVVALGDSITADTAQAAKWGGGTYWSWLTQAVEEEPRLRGAVNAGIPGDTTEGMAARFARDVAVHEPRVVVILGGTNDLSQGRTPEQVLGTLEQLAAMARDAGATPVLATIPPRADSPYAERTVQLNDAIRRSGEQSGTTVIDFFSVLADDDGRWRPGFTEDGIHPTEAAAEAMGRLAAETLVED